MFQPCGLCMQLMKAYKAEMSCNLLIDSATVLFNINLLTIMNAAMK